MRRLLIALAAAPVLAGATYGAAATLGGLQADQLGADDAQVESCDTNSVNASFETELLDNRWKVPTVTVSGIADLCIGQTLELFLTQGGTAIAGTTASAVIADDVASVDDNPTNLTITTPPLAEDVDDIHIVISG
jgi:hypothetical protein